MTMQKAIGIGIAVVVVLGAGWYFFSTYLVSKLDGTGGVQVPQTTLVQYGSEEGVSFLYPNTYELSSRTDGNAEREWDVLLLLPKGYVPPQGGEGPPAIAVSIFPNTEGTGLEAWVKGDARSNYKLSSTGALTAGVVGGEEALFYQHSGLYETDAVAVAKGGKIYLFSAGWLSGEDQIRSDFQELIKTVQFN
jgi:hypothetical protein